LVPAFASVTPSLPTCHQTSFSPPPTSNTCRTLPPPYCLPLLNTASPPGSSQLRSAPFRQENLARNRPTSSFLPFGRPSFSQSLAFPLSCGARLPLNKLISSGRFPLSTFWLPLRFLSLCEVRDDLQKGVPRPQCTDIFFSPDPCFSPSPLVYTPCSSCQPPRSFGNSLFWPPRFASPFTAGYSAHVLCRVSPAFF